MVPSFLATVSPEARGKRLRSRASVAEIFLVSPSPALAAMSTEKLSRKHRKQKEASDPAQDERPSKSKKAKPDEPTDDPAADPNGAEQIGTQAREKKHKKRKHAEREDVSRAGMDVEEPKKKRKKRRHDEGTGDAEDPVAHGGVNVVNGQEADEKKKRKKRAKVVDGSAEVAVDTKVKKAKRRHADGEAEAVEEGVSVPAQPADGSKEDKKKKEKKKKKHKGDGDAEAAEGDAPKTTEADGNGKHKKKRKHRPSSGLPDPSEDESLTDQARKGSSLPHNHPQFIDLDSSVQRCNMRFSSSTIPVAGSSIRPDRTGSSATYGPMKR